MSFTKETVMNDLKRFAQGIEENYKIKDVEIHITTTNGKITDLGYYFELNAIPVLITMPYVEDEFGGLYIKEKKWTVSKGFMEEKTFDILGAAIEFAIEKSDTNENE